MSLSAQTVDNGELLPDETVLSPDVMPHSRSRKRRLCCSVFPAGFSDAVRQPDQRVEVLQQDEKTEVSVDSDDARSRTLTPFAPMSPKDVGVHFAPVQFLASAGEDNFEADLDANAMPLKRSRGRRPTPFQHTPPVGSSVHFLDDVADEVPFWRSRTRTPTPFQHESTREGVRFGLATIRDEDVQHTRIRGRPRRLNSEDLVAIPNGALTERVPTPPASGTHVVEELSEDSARFSLNRNAFENALPCHECSATEECAVCHESLRGNDSKLFPCGHFYHTDCILQWFQRQLTCPLCRRSFLPELSGLIEAASNRSHVTFNATSGAFRRSRSV